jgi:hypothetical protein
VPISGCLRNNRRVKMLPQVIWREISSTVHSCSDQKCNYAKIDITDEIESLHDRITCMLPMVNSVTISVSLVHLRSTAAVGHSPMIKMRSPCARIHHQWRTCRPTAAATNDCIGHQMAKYRKARYASAVYTNGHSGSYGGRRSWGEGVRAKTATMNWLCSRQSKQ